MDPITLMMMGLGLGQTIYGFVQNAHGKQLARRTVMDAYQIPDQTYQNVGMWEQLAQSGLPANELDWMHQNATRALSASLSAGLQVGGDANTVNDYYQSYLDKMGEFGVKSATMRLSNINNLANAREDLANQQQIKFGYAEAQKRDQAQLAAQEQQQGMQNIFGGVNTAATSVVQGENRKLYQDQINNQTEALSLDRNQGVQPSSLPRTYNGAPIGINNTLPPPPDNTQVITNWLKRNNLSTNSTDASGFYWQKYGANGNLFDWTHGIKY